MPIRRIVDRDVSTHNSSNTLWVRGSSGVDGSWVIESPESNINASRARIRVTREADEEGITLDEAKLSSIEAGGYSTLNQYVAQVAVDDRANTSYPTGLGSSVANRYIKFNGSSWKRSNNLEFDRLNVADATNTLIYEPVEVRSSIGDALLSVESTPITTYTESAPYRIRFREDLQKIIWEGDRAGATRVAQVVEDAGVVKGLPDPVSGVIPLESYHVYYIDDDVTLEYPLSLPTDGAPIGIVSQNPDNNNLIFDIGTEFAIQGTNAGGLYLSNVIISGENGTEKLFDVTQIDSEDFSDFRLRNSRFTNFADLGTITGFRDVAIFDTSFKEYSSGLTLDDTLNIVISGTRFESSDTSGTTDLSLTGTMTGASITTTQFTTANNAHALYIDPTSTIEQGSVVSNVYKAPTGGSFFAAGSLDQTDLNWRFVSNGDVPDSAVVGSYQYTSNTTVTVLSVQGTDGNITAFADAGGGLVTVTDAGHGQSDGNNVLITETDNYNGLYTISNTTANTYDITATFVATELGTSEFGWTDITPVAAQGAATERFSFTSLPNKLTYLDAPTIKATIVTDTTATESSSGKLFELMIFRRPSGGIYDMVTDSRKIGEFDTRAKGLGWAVTVEMTTNDTFKKMVRNMEGIEDITFIDDRMTILKA